MLHCGFGGAVLVGEEEVIMQEGLHTEGGGVSSREGGGHPEGCL